jgi:hypothetical protein
MMQKIDPVMPGEIELPSSNTQLYSGYNYKYQEQERQDELGLNWDSFKWRNYDYAIGRFMCVDPLAEKYAYNSTYAFQENKMGMGRELEGLELMPWDYLRIYVASKIAMFNSNVSSARSDLHTAIGNRIQASVAGEKNNVNISGYNVNAVNDYSTMSKSVAKIGKESLIRTKEVVKDGAEITKKVGDGMIVASPLAGPFAPEVAGTGEVISRASSTTINLIDASNGNLKQAATNAIMDYGFGELTKSAIGATRAVAGKEAVEAGKNITSEAIIKANVKTAEIITDKIKEPKK